MSGSSLPVATAYRYYQLNTTNNTTSYAGYQQVAEFRLSTSTGGTNLATGKTTTASSDSGGANVPSSATDANPATFWSSTGGLNQTLTVDLVTAAAVAEFAVTARNNDSTGAQQNTPSDFTLRGSNDGTAFTTLYTATGQTWTLGETKAYTFATPSAAVTPTPTPTAAGRNYLWVAT